MVQKFIKKPLYVQAIQLSDSADVLDEIYKFLGIFGRGNFTETGNGIDPVDGKFKISTLEGVMIANIGDWIIKGVKGEFYPCKDDVFKMTYDVCVLKEGENG